MAGFELPEDIGLFVHPQVYVDRRPCHAGPAHRIDHQQVEVVAVLDIAYS